MRTKRGVVVLILIVILLICGFVGWNYVKSTPQYSLYQMYKAVDNRDYESFVKYVDTDSLIDNVVDKALTASQTQQAQEATQKDEWYQLGYQFGQGLVAMMKPALKEQVKTQFKKQIEDGSFKKEYRPANLVTAMTKIKTKMDGKIASVELPQENNTDTLALKMRQKDSYWQIFDMEMDLSNLKTDIAQNQATTTVTVSPTIQPEVVIEKKVGEEVELATLKFTVNDSEEKQSISSKYGNPKTAKEEAKFVIVDISATNTLKENITFYSDGFILIDNQNRKFESYSNTIGNIDNYLDMRELAPSIKEQGVLVYEIPQDANSYSLIVGKQGTNETYKVVLK